jgi:serine protease AprX
MRTTLAIGSIIVMVAGCVLLAVPCRAADQIQATSVIVQGRDMALAAKAVRSVGGRVTHELGIIRAVGAELTPAQLERLKRLNPELRVYANGQAKTSC